MTVAELLDRVSSRELSEWMMFYKEEPFGYETDMLGHAVTASTIANVNRKKGSKALTPQEFIPKFKQEAETLDETINFVRSLNAMYGGKEIKNGIDDS